MLFILSLSFALIGVLLLATLILFYYRAESPGESRSYGEFSIDKPLYHGGEDLGESGATVGLKSAGDAGQVAPGGGAKGAAGVSEENEEEASSVQVREGSTIPVLQLNKPVPGIGRYELVHYSDRGAFASIEDSRDPEEIKLDESRLSLEVEGEVVLTSRNIVIFNEKSSKKIPIYTIEKFHFYDAFLVMKRRSAKKKKDVIKIAGNLAGFMRILGTLVHP